MFSAKVKETDVFRTLISAVAEIIDEGIFKISDKGMSLTAPDRAMVAVVDLNIKPQIFESFKVEGEEKLGIDIPNFLSILKRAGGKDKVSLELKDSKLSIVIENSSKRSFTLPLLEISEEEVPNIEQLEFKARVKMKPEVLQSGIEDASVVTDSVVLEATPSVFVMRAEGDVTSARLELEKGSESLLELEVKEEIKARYPLDYLRKMVKVARIANEVTVEWGNDYPMKMSFEMNGASISFVLAPRVTEE